MIVPRRRALLAALTASAAFSLVLVVTRETWERERRERMAEELQTGREEAMGEAEERSREDAVGRDDSGFRREYVKGVRLRRGLFIVLSKNLQR